ncbi:GNAT family N-acetyltransferase [Polaromonas jejuensis]|uniref:GNAT family N-acetyltransferase n=1 Tax=Polaromonas jejuensis TaxID=457502 RepID=A0ABW0QHF4_9BURK|nr:GNAT family N-acetyltransferase [Polaromonas jejuensis]
MTQPIEIETPRLRLRQWRPADREPFAALNADPKVMEFFPALLDRSASDAMAGRCESLIAGRGWGFWAAEIKAAGQFIGFVGLHTPMAELPFSPCVEIGWRLASDYWGKGFATEAAAGALDVAFGRLELSEIVSFTALGNLRSQSVMQRLGMQRSSTNFAHPGVPAGSPLREHCLYRLTQAQWRRRQPDQR